MTTRTSYQTAIAQPARWHRAVILPLALAGGLVFFGAHGAGAANSGTYDLSWGTIVADGTYNAQMVDNDTLVVSVPSGTAAVNINDANQLDLAGGDQVVVTKIKNGTINSISIRVLKGDATIRTIHQEMDQDTGAVTNVAE